MCYERWRTRDRLLEYDSVVIPPHPHSAGLPMIYPWEDMPLSVLSHQLFEIAKKNGFEGAESEFLEKFSHNTGGVNTGTIETFPVPGKEDQLYLDVETEILYYFKIAQESVAEEIATQYGAEVVGRTEDGTFYVYIPVRALPVEPLFIDCGTSTDVTD